MDAPSSFFYGARLPWPVVWSADVVVFAVSVMVSAQPIKDDAQHDQNDYDNPDESAAAPGTSASWASVGGARLGIRMP